MRRRSETGRVDYTGRSSTRIVGRAGEGRNLPTPEGLEGRGVDQLHLPSGRPIPGNLVQVLPTVTRTSEWRGSKSEEWTPHLH